ncbi:MAG: GNAT family N-acetyltransferase [Candidatus Scalindua sp.]|nr:GNAT family N-acetyltransferase [Candidatus Scalindua sp.]
MLSIKKVITQNEFLELKYDWAALLRKSRGNTLFLTWEWMYTWWECFQGDRQLLILTVYGESGKLDGIAPLYINKKKLGSISVMKYIKFLGTLPISSDHLDFIISKGEERKVLGTIVEYLFQESRWDYCLLTNIPATSLTGRLLKEIMGNRPFQSEISQVCPYIPLPDQIEEFYSSLSSNRRNTIKRRKRNLQKNYKGFELVTLENPDEIDDAMERLFKLHGEKWRAVKHEGNFTRSDVRDFHKKIARTFLNADMLGLYFLRVQGKDVAALYTFKYNNKLFYYQGGWDPEWSKDRVGSILTNLVIEDAINRGYSEYDFLRGTENYKIRLTDKKKEEIDIFISNSFNSRIYLLFRNLYHKAKAFRQP